MSEAALGEAKLAARLYALAPRQLGGLSLRGGGPARELVLAGLRENLPDAAWRKLPGHVDDERLLGGIDVAASLAEGRAVVREGLLAEARGGVLAVPLAERLRDEVAGCIAQAMDEGASFGLVLLDDGIEPDERPPAALLERVAFHCDLSQVAALESVATPADPLAVANVEPADDNALAALVGTANALGIESARPLMFALIAARAHAALQRRQRIEEDDLQVAARLVLAPRATRLPPEREQDQDQDQAPIEPPSSEPCEDPETTSRSDSPLDDLVLEAALAALPSDLLAQLSAGRMRCIASGGSAGKRTRSRLRGRPLGAQCGVPRGGARLALIDTLRAAVPWQAARRAGGDAGGVLIVRKPDLRVRRFEQRAGAVTVFCVDASGSAAAARLAEAKGAVQLMLAQAYVERTEVALIAFRGTTAELLLPPTRSLTRARRVLAALPGGGGTPLAAGIIAAHRLAEAIAARGRTPFVVFLTDGKANVAADCSPGRTAANEDALAAAKAMAASSCEALVIDISPRPVPDAHRLADSLRARYLPLPLADARALERAVSAARPAQTTA